MLSSTGQFTLHFLLRLQDCHVLVRTNSTVAATYVNRKCGLGSPRLGQLAHKLWTWAHPRFLSLRATYLLGPLNTAVDLLSRGGLQPGEWRLYPEVVAQIWQRFGGGSSRPVCLQGDSPLP